MKREGFISKLSLGCDLGKKVFNVSNYSKFSLRVNKSIQLLMLSNCLEIYQPICPVVLCKV